jgi:hypothetical protein
MSDNYSAKLMSKKPKSGHKEKARAAVEGQRKIQKRFAPAQYLDPNEIQRERTIQARDGTGPVDYFPIHSTFRGQYIRGDKKDDDLEFKEQLLETGKVKGQGALAGGQLPGFTKWGMLTLDKDTEQALKDKKYQEENMYLLALGAQQIDPKNPMTQEHVFEMLPELKTYPDEFHMQEVAVQEALRGMLRAGKIGGKTDLQLIATVIRDDFELPLHALWDPDGMIMRQAVDAKTPAEAYVEANKRAIFNPFKFAVQDGGNAKELQRKVKRMILRRLFANLKDAGDNELNKWIFKENIAFPEATGTETVNYPRMTNDWFSGLKLTNALGLNA